MSSTRTKNWTASENPELPFPYRLFNSLGHFGFQPDITVSGLIRKTNRLIARWFPEHTLGADDCWATALGHLVDAINGEPDIHPWGRVHLRRVLFHRLVTRSLVEAFLNRHPEIAATPVPKPIFVIGPPRTGTTILHRLLSLDASLRAPRSWELYSAAVPPPKPETHAQDSRIATVARAIATQRKIRPEAFVVHPTSATDPEECYPLLERAFASPTFCMYGNLDSYLRWLGGETREDGKAVADAYSCHKKQLQLLQLHFPQRTWLLKAPVHFRFVRSLLKTYPDARIVCMHRGPEEWIPSVSSLVATARGFVSRRLSFRSVGSWALASYAEESNHHLAMRDGLLDPGRLLDLRYEDLMSDPVGTVGRIHDYFGVPQYAEMDMRIRQYLSEHRQHKHGKHVYTMDQFGLSREETREALREYCERFGV